MANSIDFTTLALGALIGIGCKEQLKTAGRVAATTAASLAAVAAQAAAQVAEETSPEAAAARQKVAEVNQKIDQQLAGSPLAGQAPQGQGNGQNG